MLQAIIYTIALLLPSIFGLVVGHTGFVDWLWYSGYEQEYYKMATLKEAGSFKTFLSGWPLAVFTGVVLFYWVASGELETVHKQFPLLPLAFVPFSILGTMLISFKFDVSTLYVHPLIIIPAGYLYIFPWLILVWVMKKIGIII